MSTTTSREWVKASELPKDYENLHWRDADTKRKVDPIAFKYDTMVITDNQEPHESYAVDLSALEYLEEKEVPVTTDAEIREVLKEADKYLSHTTYEKGKPVMLNSIGAGSVLHRKITAASQSIPSKAVDQGEVEEKRKVDLDFIPGTGEMMDGDY